MCLNYCIIFFFFSICACTFSICSFVVFTSAAIAHRIIVFLKKLIFYLMKIVYSHKFLNIGVISFTNKEIVYFFQLHTYKFGLVYDMLSRDHPISQKSMQHQPPMRK